MREDTIATYPRTIFIGDVHGLSGPLDDLLEQIQLKAGDRLVFVGDLLDKGPDQIGVVRRVGSLMSRRDIQTSLIRGNHEDKHIRYQRNLKERPGIAAAQAKDTPSLADFHQKAKPADCEVVHKSLPYLHLPDINMIAVHGGIPPFMTRLPALEQFHKASGRTRQKLEQVYRLRFVNRETGAFLKLGDQGESDPFWAEIYDGRFGFAVFGHEPFMTGPRPFPNAMGIDTDAVHGNNLTALITMDGNPQAFEIVQTSGEPHAKPRGDRL